MASAGRAPSQGLAEFWDCLDPKAKTALRRVQKDAILDQVMCADCRILVTDATTSLEQVAKQPTKAKSRFDGSGPGSGGAPAPPMQSPRSPQSKSSSSSTIVLSRGADGKFVCTGGRFGNAPPPSPTAAAPAAAVGPSAATGAAAVEKGTANAGAAIASRISSGRQPNSLQSSSSSSGVDPSTGLRPLAEFSGAGNPASAAFLLLDEGALEHDLAALTAVAAGSGSNGSSGGSGSTKKGKGKNAKSPSGRDCNRNAGTRTGSRESLELGAGDVNGVNSKSILAAVAARAARLSSLNHHASVTSQYCGSSTGGAVGTASNNSFFPPSSPRTPTRKGLASSSSASSSSSSSSASSSSFLFAPSEPDKGVVAPLGAKVPPSAYGFVRKPCVGKPGSVIVCCGYCYDKLKLKIVDTLTYPRPVKQFQLLVDGATTLGALKDLLLTEVDPAAELTRDEVVLRARGKVLEAAREDWTLDALGLLNYQQVVILRTLGKGSRGEDGTHVRDSGNTSANEAARRGLEERNKQFVGDLLFGHTSPGFGLLSGGNSKETAGLGAHNGSSSGAGGCFGGALGSSNGGNGSGSGVSVRDLYRMKHGLQILTNGLRLEVEARVYSAWRAEEAARQHESDLLQLLLDDDDQAASDKFSTPTAKGKKSLPSSKKSQNSEGKVNNHSRSGSSSALVKSDSASSFTSPVSSKSSGITTSMPTSNEPASSSDDQGNCRATLMAGDSNTRSSDSGNKVAPASLSGATSSKKAKGKEKEKEKDKRKKEAAAAAKREAAEEAQRAAAAEGRRLQALEVVEQRRREEAQWTAAQEARRAHDDAEHTAQALAAIASAEATAEERRRRNQQQQTQGQQTQQQPGQKQSSPPNTSSGTAPTNAWQGHEQLKQQRQQEQQRLQQQPQPQPHASSLQVAPVDCFPASPSQPRFCHQCGGGLVAGSKFCSSCGAPVVVLAVPPPPPPPLSPSVISPPTLQRHVPSQAPATALGEGVAFGAQLSPQALISSSLSPRNVHGPPLLGSNYDGAMLLGAASASTNPMEASLSFPLAFLSLDEVPAEQSSLGGGSGGGALEGGMAPAAFGGDALFGGLDNRNLGLGEPRPGEEGQNQLSFFQFLDDDDSNT